MSANPCASKVLKWNSFPSFNTQLRLAMQSSDPPASQGGCCRRPRRLRVRFHWYCSRLSPRCSSPLVDVAAVASAVDTTVVTGAMVVEVTTASTAALDEDDDAFSEPSRPCSPPSVSCSAPVGDRDSEIDAAGLPDDGSPVCSGVALAQGEETKVQQQRTSTHKCSGFQNGVFAPRLILLSERKNRFSALFSSS